ncbi:MAG: HD-GYP domain-containing protein [Lautropia sp.]
MATILEQTTLTGTATTTSRRYQIGADDLRMGMFVVELDRPWLDTPFLLQGFLIDSQVELDTLGKYCEYAYVDIDRSTPAAAEIVRRVEIRTNAPEDAAEKPKPFVPVARPGSSVAVGWTSSVASGSAGGAAEAADAAMLRARQRASSDAATPGIAGPIVARAASQTEDAGAKKPYKSRADVRISQQTRERFRAMVKQTAVAKAEANEEGIVGRMFGWAFNLLGRETVIEAPRETDPAAFMPAGVERVVHKDRRSMVEELPRARQAFTRGESVLADMVSDIRSGKLPQVKDVGAAVDSMVDSMLDNPDALMWIARLREEDITTYNHGVKVALYLVALGRHLGFPKRELNHLGQIGMLADIGKTKVPRAILEKPGMLSPAEFEKVKEHVTLGLSVFAEGPPLPEVVVNGIAQHHERVNGSGYPKGLKGPQISIYGKMAAIADSFAALITPRAYANASAPQDALMNLYEWTGTSFHEPLVEQFVQAVGVFPVGSMVELNTGEVAVVVAHNRIRRLEPKVLVISAPDKSPLAQPLERDLFKEGKKKEGKPCRITRGLPAGAFGFKLRDYYLDEVAKQNGILS